VVACRMLVALVIALICVTNSGLVWANSGIPGRLVCKASWAKPHPVMPQDVGQVVVTMGTRPLLVTVALENATTPFVSFGGLKMDDQIFPRKTHKCSKNVQVHEDGIELGYICSTLNGRTGHVRNLLLTAADENTFDGYIHLGLLESVDGENSLNLSNCQPPKH
jgi:hypothetical protein